jgi:hypothetical protein
METLNIGALKSLMRDPCRRHAQELGAAVESIEFLDLQIRYCLEEPEAHGCTYGVPDGKGGIGRRSRVGDWERERVGLVREAAIARAALEACRRNPSGPDDL